MLVSFIAIRSYASTVNVSSHERSEGLLQARRIEGYTEAIPFALISLKESNNPIIATLELALRNRKERFIDQLDASAEEGLI